MIKNTNRLSKRIFKVIWSGIIVVSLYLIYRFAALTVTDHSGQADDRLSDTIISDLCCKVMENGVTLISYNTKGEENEFPIAFATAGLTLQDYIENNASLTANAQAIGSWKEGRSVAASDKTIEVMNTEQILYQPDYYDVSKSYLSKEYILSNGLVYNSLMAGKVSEDNETGQLEVGYEEGDVYYEDDSSAQEASQAVNASALTEFTMEQLKNTDFLVHNFYIVDSSTKITEELFDGQKLLDTDMTMEKDSDNPQILIYHTHSQEAYIDSSADDLEETVVGVGSYLTDILENDYGYKVIHDKTTYDIIDGKLNRSAAYSKAEDGIDKILEENPSIEVVIDLHRDGGSARNVTIDGKETARVMLFNGLSRDQNGPITYLDNPNLQDNLAFSLQLQLKSYELYPGFFNKNYLKCYRYNMHVRPRSLLVELGTDKNTLESAKNAMEPFAKVLDAVLKGE